MTNCPDDIKTLLSRMVDGEIAPDERARAEEHLAGCAPCRELLDLFRKNEALLANALESEAFGNAVIGSVIRTIRLEGPPEADPVEDGPLEWLRSRPWIPVSAAAACLLALGGLVFRQSSELGRLREAVETSRAAQLDILKASASSQEQQERLLRDLRTSDAAAGSNKPLGYVEDQGVVVKCGFDPRQFDHYEIWRRGEKDVDFQKLNTAKGEERLRQPEYVDRTARPGQLYAYRFRALRPNGEAVESTPLQIRVPLSDELTPEQSVQVHCFDLAVTRDVGIFLLKRMVGGQEAVEKFVVRLGEPIGGVAGGIDYSTGLTLGRIEEAHQTLPLSYAEPVLDEQGRPVIQKLEGGTAVPLTRQHDVPLSIRANLRAVFRTGTGSDVLLYKGSALRVKAK